MFIFRNMKLTVRQIVQCLKVAAGFTCIYHWALKITTMRRVAYRPRWRKVVVQLLWPVPVAAVTVLCSPDDGCDGHPKHVEWFCSK